jgi:hypothetical protein
MPKTMHFTLPAGIVIVFGSSVRAPAAQAGPGV